MNPLDSLTSALRTVVGDLREKRLWPVAVLLLAAVAAVPVLLSTHSGTARPVAPIASAGTITGPDVPSVQVGTTPNQSALTGAARSPFGSMSGNGSTTASSSRSTSKSVSGAIAGTTVSSGTQSGRGSVASGGGSSASGSTAASTAPSSGVGAAPSTSPATRVIPVKVKKHAPVGLSPTESYDVSLSMETASGGVDTTSSLERLSEVPSASNPLLVELGVLKGGSRVVFAVRPGASVSGPGACVPGPIDCQVLSLANGQIEELSGGSLPLTQFAVTGIGVSHDGSVRAAQNARSTASAAGRALLGQDPLQAYSLFPYVTGFGAVVDQRNLTIGGL